MPSPRRPTLLLAFALAVLVPSLAAAQDGPLRTRLKERMAERQRQAASDADASPLQAGRHALSLQHAGVTRSFLVHVPKSYVPDRAAPMLVALHGGGGSMEFMADDARYGLISLSEKHGIVTVFPNGFSKLRSGKFATWNAGRCCGGARDSRSDDVGFIRAAVAEVSRRWRIDARRIYATGMSNGAMMSYRLACEMPDVFAAIAAVAGTDNTATCTPGRPVSVLHIHARNDTHVLFGGGAGPGVRDKEDVNDFSPVPDTVAKWSRQNACPAAPRRILEKPGAYCEAYSPCEGASRVQLCVTEDGGHSWPGAARTRNEPASQAISAGEVMWEFFNRR